MKAHRTAVALVGVDDDVLEQLVLAATTTASPDEVSPLGGNG
ncbi:MAG: hypothetical protein WA892_04795 [Ornithinimicrobium sp.]